MGKQLTHEEFVKRMQEINPNIKIVGNYTNSANKINCKCLIDGYEWSSIPVNLVKGHGCPICSKSHKYTTKEYFDKVNIETNGEFELKSEYIKAFGDVTILHKKCNREFTMRANNFNNKHLCPLCYLQNRVLKNKEMFYNSLAEKGNDEYEVLEDYIDAETRIKLLHKPCNTIVQIKPAYFLNRGAKCPSCSAPSVSHGEDKIENFLILNLVDYIPQYRFPDCRYINPLPFDFATFVSEKLICLIEFDGKQHDSPVKHFGGEETFQKQKIKDAIKTEYCNKNGIPLLRISRKDSKNVPEILQKELIEKYNI